VREVGLHHAVQRLIVEDRRNIVTVDPYYLSIMGSICYVCYDEWKYIKTML